MSLGKASIRKVLLIAAVLGAAGLMSGCVYEPPAYPSYAAAYPGGGYPSAYDYPYYYGPTIGVGVGYGYGWGHPHGGHHWH